MVRISDRRPSWANSVEEKLPKDQKVQVLSKTSPVAEPTQENNNNPSSEESTSNSLDFSSIRRSRDPVPFVGRFFFIVLRVRTILFGASIYGLCRL